MNRFLALLFTAALIAVPAARAETAAPADVPTFHWGYAPILTILELGILSTDASGNFRPDEALTRGSMAIAIVRQTGEKRDAPAGASFSDVPTSSPYFAAVETMKSAGWASGFPDGTFRPGEPVTRAQFLKILLTANGQKLPETTGDADFADVPGGHWALAPARFALRSGLVTGYSEGGKLDFRPDAPVTRAQAAKIMAQFLKNEGLVPTDSPIGTGTSVANAAVAGPSADLTPAENFVGGLVNLLRAQEAKKGALQIDSNLSRVARLHAQWLRDNAKKSQHEGEDGSTVSGRLRTAGVSDWTAAGENVGWATSNSRSLVDTLLAIHTDPQGGMMSQADDRENHRTTILGTFHNWSRVGVGVATKDDDATGTRQVWVVEVFAE